MDYSVCEIEPLVGSFVERRSQHPEESLGWVVEGQTRLDLRGRVRLGTRELDLVDKDLGLLVDKRLSFLVVQVDLGKKETSVSVTWWQSKWKSEMLTKSAHAWQLAI